MTALRAGALMALALASFATPAVAQDWLVNPAPLVPLHVPALTSPVPAIPPAPPIHVVPPEPQGVVDRTPDPIGRMLNPYGVSRRPASIARPSATPVPLPSVALPPDSALNVRPFATPIVKLPLIPVGWPFGL